jgi:hypothetical protein
MHKKKNLRVALTLALALVLCLGSMTTVFAASGDPSTGTEDNPAKAAITKTLQAPEGTNLPTGGIKFTFEIAAVSVDGVAAATAGNMPAVDSAEITVTNANAGTPADNITPYTAQSGDAAESIFDGVNFPHAGEYVYKITETPASVIATPTDGWTETVTSYDGASYTLTLVVKAKSSTGYFIETIYALYDQNGDGATDAEDGKVTPTPGDGSASFSEILFTNTFSKTKGGDPATDATLTVGAAVAGDYADTTWYFPYEVAITEPAFVTAQNGGTPGTYKAYVLNSANTVVTAAENYPSGTLEHDDDYGDYIAFTSGAAAATVRLSDGQKLVFVGTPVGTAWTAVDVLGSGAPHNLYTASGSVDSVALDTTGITQGASLSTGSRLVIEAGSVAAFTNTREDVSPTGILLNNLPYIGLILLAVAALVVFVVLRARKRAVDS